MKNIGISLITFILLAGCTSNNTPPVVKKEVQSVQKTTTPPIVPPKPTKDIKLKEVEDTNYSSAYMYPQDTVKKETVTKDTTQKEKIATPAQTPLATNSDMNKAECIAMISQEKFDKYAAMFGSETASIKRCNMIKAMNQ